MSTSSTPTFKFRDARHRDNIDVTVDLPRMETIEQMTLKVDIRDTYASHCCNVVLLAFSNVKNYVVLILSSFSRFIVVNAKSDNSSSRKLSVHLGKLCKVV